MGVIADRLKELMPKYNYLRKLESEINTQELMKSLVSFVYNIFYELRPLSHKFRVVKTISLKRYSYTYKMRLGIGTWFRVASSWQKYGSDADRREVFDIVRSHGDEILDYLRRPIRKDFSQLVTLTKQLKPYDEQTVSHVITRRIVRDYAYSYSEGKMILKEYEIDRVRVLTSYPRCVHLLPTSKEVEKKKSKWIFMMNLILLY